VTSPLVEGAGVCPVGRAARSNREYLRSPTPHAGSCRPRRRPPSGPDPDVPCPGQQLSGTHGPSNDACFPASRCGQVFEAAHAVPRVPTPDGRAGGPPRHCAWVALGHIESGGPTPLGQGDSEGRARLEPRRRPKEPSEAIPVFPMPPANLGSQGPAVTARRPSGCGPDHPARLSSASSTPDAGAGTRWPCRAGTKVLDGRALRSLSRPGG
jgi:hypothetical protein